MSQQSIEFDIAESLRQFFAERLFFYPEGGPGQSTTAHAVSGFTEFGLPYGDVYRVGDTFIDRGLPAQKGVVYYVAAATPGDPALTLEREAPRALARPVVNRVNGIFAPEIRENTVHVGVRIRPSSRNSRTELPRGFLAHRVPSADGTRAYVTTPFWLGSVYLHIESHDADHNSYVIEQLNKGYDLPTRLYQLLVKFRPSRLVLENRFIASVYKSVMTVDLSAQLTPDTPYDALPPIPNHYVYSHDELLGLRAFVEEMVDGADDLPTYAEPVPDPLDGDLDFEFEP